ncbi:hypothetical protein AQ962_03665 [Burkholderia pseudomallei]|uniref:hypothetical protein n=1 Tax=Burkholderia pseudomallei TaxID=28450 RepID=UPI000977CC05|nr:hypothetical protein [Burkholderia pseudomallei]OMW13626.1 hypothetical protein AQ804_30000 [Burkholderia pseudomallei]OMW19936.1 hypothetical protein AQ805_02930 [Burkholderia pseudomallei]ONF14173.1 hypothetical protein AQ962_03665 [Burkholderia pseudomallei]ONF14243.1 hypothetical protein AQ961_22000 [Burkholderia pseudomallei]ONF19218.1 hypothetical protein AQ963_29430 [Burkholderia pseudomallei]
MAVNPKTLEECSAWLKKANALDKARFAAKQAAAKPEGATSLNKALEESRRRAGGPTAADVSKQTGTARFVSWVNGVSKAHDDADRTAAERVAQRMQKDGAPSAGAKSGTSNPRPQQVDANGRMTGDIKDPGIGAGRVTPLTVASTADGGGAAIWDFFHPRCKRNGSN